MLYGCCPGYFPAESLVCGGLQDAGTSFNFNVFELAEATDNRPLSVLGFYLLKVRLCTAAGTCRNANPSHQTLCNFASPQSMQQPW